MILTFNSHENEDDELDSHENEDDELGHLAQATVFIGGDALLGITVTRDVEGNKQVNVGYWPDGENWTSLFSGPVAAG